MKTPNVYLYRVGRNLNRAYRTCEFFGVQNIYTVQCDALLKGNLFAAKGRVAIETREHLPDITTAIWFETDGGVGLDEIDWNTATDLVFGGESHNLPNCRFAKRVRINGSGMVSGLTVEAALAIALNSMFTNVQIKG